MAVLSILPGVEAQILVNGSPSAEYDFEDEVQLPEDATDVELYERTHTVTKYIQSEDDQTFSIRFIVGSPYVKGNVMDHVRLGFHISVDGARLADTTLSRMFFKNKPTGTKWIEEVKGVTSKVRNKFQLKEFYFSSIKTTSDDEGRARNMELAKEISRVGVIEVRVYSENTKKAGVSKSDVAKLKTLDDREIPEKAMKGLEKSHSTSLGRAKSVPKGGSKILNKQTSEDYPQVVFKFLYRNQEALKKLGVLRRTPSPSSSPEPEPEPELFVPQEPEVKAAATAQLSEAQQAALKDILRTLSQNSNSSNGVPIKQENPQKRVIVKRERVDRGGHSRPMKKARKSKEKVTIDLTADTDDEEAIELTSDAEIADTNDVVGNDGGDRDGAEEAKRLMWK